MVTVCCFANSRFLSLVSCDTCTSSSPLLREDSDMLTNALWLSNLLEKCGTGDINSIGRWWWWWWRGRSGNGSKKQRRKQKLVTNWTLEHRCLKASRNSQSTSPPQGSHHLWLDKIARVMDSHYRIDYLTGRTEPFFSGWSQIAFCRCLDSTTPSSGILSPSNVALDFKWRVLTSMTGLMMIGRNYVTA